MDQEIKNELFDITSKILGKKWPIYILAVLTKFSILSYTRLKEEISNQFEMDISSPMLSSSLELLEEHSLLSRVSTKTSKPPRFNYTLTEKGEDFTQVFSVLKGWGSKWGVLNRNESRGQDVFFEEVDIDLVKRMRDFKGTLSFQTSEFKYSEVPQIVQFSRKIYDQEHPKRFISTTIEAFNDFFLNINKGALLIDAETLRIFEANRVMEELIGYNQEDFKKMKISDISLEPEKMALVFADLTNAEISRLSNQSLRKKDGTSIIVDGIARAMIKNDREVFLLFVDDITSEAIRRDQLRESESEYRSLVEHISDIIFIISPITSEISLLNYSFERILGWSRENWLQIPLYPLIHPEDRRKFDHSIFKDEIRLKNKNGEFLFFEISTTPLIKAGKVSNILGIAHDITERKKMEKALEKSNHMLNERIKELNCLYRLSNLVLDTQKSIDEVFANIIDLIPPAWQWPKVTCARITFNGKKFTTNNFQKTPWRLSADIIVSGTNTGLLEVCYLKEMPRFEEGPFLKEERDLIDGIARGINEFVERKRAGEKLRESEERLRAFMDSATSGFILFDSQLNYLDLNKVALATLGFTKEEMIGKNILDIFPQLKESDGIRQYKKVIKTGESFIHYSDKLEEKYFVVRAFKVGEGLGVTTSDITERKKMEDALRESEDRLKHAQHVAQLGYWDWNLLTGDLYWSDEAFRMFGFEPQEFKMTYDKVMSLLHPEDLEHLEEQVQAALENNEEYNIEVRGLLPSGEIRYFHGRGEVTRDENGNAIRFVGTQLDITELKHAEEALLASEEKYRSIFHNANDALFLREFTGDGSGHFLDVNDIACRMLGYTRGELLSISPKNLVDPENLGKTSDWTKEITAKGHSRFESGLIAKNGHIIPVELSGHLFPLSGKIMLLSVAQDITERKRLDEAL